MRAVAIVLTMCGAVEAAPATRASADLALPTEERAFLAAMEIGDAAVIRGYLSTRIELDGIWFEDAACRTAFGASAEVVAADLDRFAACLATLHVQLSSRSHDYNELAVTYAPGIEIDIVLGTKTTIRSIGYVSRRGSDVRPTLMPDALGIVDDPLIDGYAWLKVCIDARGAVISISPRAASSRAASDTFHHAVRRWRLKPFELAGHPATVCSVVRSGVVRGSWDRQLPSDPFGSWVSVSELEGYRLTGTTEVARDEPKGRYPGLESMIKDDRRFEGMFELDIDRNGRTVSVTIVSSTGDPTYDAKIVKQLRTWTFDPYTLDGRPIPITTRVSIGNEVVPPAIIPAG